MNSIIVLDSSDEDESPPLKRKYLSPVSNAGALCNRISDSNKSWENTKQRKICRSLTAGARSSPTIDHDNRQSPKSLLYRNSKNIMKHMPPLQPAPHLKQIQRQESPHTITSPTTIPTLPIRSSPTLLSMLSIDGAMTASVTPPMKLLATPPHTAGCLNDPIILSPKTMSSGLQQSVTIAPQTVTNNNNVDKDCVESSKSITKSTESPQKATLSKPKNRATLVTVLKSTDEAWQATRQQPIMALGDDGLMEVIDFPNKKHLSSPKLDINNRIRKSTKTSTSEFQQLSISPSPTLSKIGASKEIAQNSSRLLHEKHNKSSNAENTTLHEMNLNSAGTKELETTTRERPNGKLPNEEVIPKHPSIELNDIKIETKTLNSNTETLQPDYKELLQVCREAESSPDMEKLIKNKLLRYYYEVPQEFVKSRDFRKTIRKVIENIRESPDLVYYNLKIVVEELNIRRKSKKVVMETEDIDKEETSDTIKDKRLAHQIRQLNKTLKILTLQITNLEESEVDLDDENSNYLKVERCKRRACKIYEKICQLTGENKNAHRLVKQSVQFQGSPYTEFNKTLQAYVNRTKEFPDFCDVLKMLEHCNQKYNYNLVSFEMRTIAYTAFKEIGNLLKRRRQRDLYETVAHFTSNVKDPAETDPTLKAKLSENQKYQRKVDEIIEKYAQEQEITSEKLKETRQIEKQRGSSGNDSTEEDSVKSEISENKGSITIEDPNPANISKCKTKDIKNVDKLNVNNINSNNNVIVKDGSNLSNGGSTNSQEPEFLGDTLMNQQPSPTMSVINTNQHYLDEKGYISSQKADGIQPNHKHNSVNNKMRIKTVDTAFNVAAMEPESKESCPSPNGKMSSNINSKPAPIIKARVTNMESVGLKIVSVSSLAYDKDSSLEKPVSIQKSKLQRTVAEIVISDEET